MMDDQRFDDLLREAAPSFREPPTPPLEAMWANIERDHFGAPARQKPWQRWYAPVIGMAATLMLGIGIGRLTANPVPMPGDPIVASVTRAPASPVEVSDDIAGPYRAVTSRYLGQTAALLVSLPSSGDYNADGKLVERAGELLSTTRVLLDSPAADDPELKVLLDDLELVLAQVVRLSGRRHHQEMEMITDALEERDVLPRLQNAVTSFPLSATN
jgi:hypothetical protein